MLTKEDHQRMREMLSVTNPKTNKYYSLEAIGDTFNVSRQRVAQLVGNIGTERNKPFARQIKAYTCIMCGVVKESKCNIRVCSRLCDSIRKRRFSRHIKKVFKDFTVEERKDYQRERYQAHKEYKKAYQRNRYKKKKKDPYDV